MEMMSKSREHNGAACVGGQVGRGRQIYTLQQGKTSAVAPSLKRRWEAVRVDMR